MENPSTDKPDTGVTPESGDHSVRKAELEGRIAAVQAHILDLEPVIAAKEAEVQEAQSRVEAAGVQLDAVQMALDKCREGGQHSE